MKNLEVRIKKEMNQTEEKISQMEDDMENKFPKTEDMKEQVELEKGRMSEIKKFV